MIIMGVDPGSTATGYGIIEKNGSRARHIASGVIKPPARASHSKRIWDVYQRLDSVAKEHRPSVMVVESLFHATNSQSLMKLSQVRGAILLLGETHSMDIFEYAPMEIKKGITGYGRAEKEQIIFMVSKILGLAPLKSADQADALAMALYHSHISLPAGVVS
ncbi:MAG: crossover junction endodeoxyribonuclease RuvC [Thermodesulfobacteriota bacterium]